MTRADFLRMGLLCALICAAPVAAEAPPGRYTYPASGTVYDTRTQLTWEQSVDAGTYSQSAAASYCTSLPLAGGGWRLSTIEELESIVDDTTVNPAIDVTAFAGTPNAWFWSSSPYADTLNAPGTAWGVFFSHGYSDTSSVSSAWRVRCVR